MTEEDLLDIILSLSIAIPDSAKSDVQESFFNLLLNLYKNSCCQTLIESIAVERMPKLDQYSLVHAIALIDASRRPDRDELLRGFANHDSELVRQYVRESLR